MKGKVVDEMVASSPLSQAEANRAFDAVFQAVETVVKRGESVTVRGFGTFKKTLRNERQGRNPATGEKLTIAAHEVITFKQAKGA